MLVGDSGVGKTCLLVRFKDGAFLAGSFISTVGIDFRVSLKGTHEGHAHANAYNVSTFGQNWARRTDGIWKLLVGFMSPGAMNIYYVSPDGILISLISLTCFRSTLCLSCASLTWTTGRGLTLKSCWCSNGLQTSNVFVIAMKCQNTYITCLSFVMLQL